MRSHFEKVARDIHVNRICHQTFRCLTTQSAARRQDQIGAHFRQIGPGHHQFTHPFG